MCLYKTYSLFRIRNFDEQKIKRVPQFSSPPDLNQYIFAVTKKIKLYLFLSIHVQTGTYIFVYNFVINLLSTHRSLIVFNLHPQFIGYTRINL